jgi:hypothetical protein
MAEDQYDKLMERARTWAASLPETLYHHYSHNHANEPIGLYRGPVRVSFEGGTGAYSAEGHFSLQWLPTPRILYQAEVEIDRMSAVNSIGAEWVAELPDTVQQVPDQVEADYDEPEAAEAGMAMTGQERLTVIGGSQDVAHVTFGLVNFIELHGAPIRDEDSVHYGRVALSADDWSIVLDQRREHDDLTRQLKTDGGYAFTHFGELRRTDGTPFAPADAKRILEALHYLLSFALGSFTGPMLPAGYSQGGQPTWTEWSCPTTDPWSPTYHWCDSHHPEQLVELFPLFMDKWRDPYWEGVIRLAIRYYRDANRPNPVQGAIVAAQIVLELLAYAILVENATTPMKKAYGPPAHTNFVTVLTQLGIPIDLPTNLTALTATAKQRGWHSGPQAVATLRNSVIHPKRNSRPFDNETWIDAWRLSEWYVELALLSFLGYKGTYRNRLQREQWVGSVEHVPWA